MSTIIAKDRSARMACETVVATGVARVSGEITTKTYVNR